MNDRWGGAGPEKPLSENGDGASCVPLVRPIATDTMATQEPVIPVPKRANNHGTPGRRDSMLSRDALFTVWRNNSWHVVSENYSYKTESYYSILHLEMDKRPVQPSSSSVLDAYVVPICLERAHLAGIPVCEWGISQGYAPLPSILYGLNYFATASDYAVVRDNETVKEVVKHITNKGKYPFCYQKLDEGAEIASCVAVFGKTAGDCPISADIARNVYDLFAIPLVTIVSVRYGDRCLLSSLSPVKYSRMSEAERSLLSAYLSRQEFL
jgi:hypothetical protein